MGSCGFLLFVKMSIEARGGSLFLLRPAAAAVFLRQRRRNRGGAKKKSRHFLRALANSYSWAFHILLQCWRLLIVLIPMFLQLFPGLSSGAVIRGKGMACVF